MVGEECSIVLQGTSTAVQSSGRYNRGRYKTPGTFALMVSPDIISKLQARRPRDDGHERNPDTARCWLAVSAWRLNSVMTQRSVPRLQAV